MTFIPYPLQTIIIDYVKDLEAFDEHHKKIISIR